jgi:hypothetical protein
MYIIIWKQSQSEPWNDKPKEYIFKEFKIILLGLEKITRNRKKQSHIYWTKEHKKSRII